MRITRRFKDLPVREARASLHVQPNKDDIKGATKEDPTNCAYARALKRTLDCTEVYVYRTIAYIQTLDEKGKPMMERYVVRTYAQDYLLKFDGGEKVEPGGFVFHQPSKCRSLDYKAQQSRRYRRSPHVKLTGISVKPKEYTLRRGTGCVHFRSPAGTISKR